MWLMIKCWYCLLNLCLWWFYFIKRLNLIFMIFYVLPSVFLSDHLLADDVLLFSSLIFLFLSFRSFICFLCLQLLHKPSPWSTTSFIADVNSLPQIWQFHKALCFSDVLRSIGRRLLMFSSSILINCFDIMGYCSCRDWPGRGNVFTALRWPSLNRFCKVGSLKVRYFNSLFKRYVLLFGMILSLFFYVFYLMSFLSLNLPVALSNAIGLFTTWFL